MIGEHQGVVAQLLRPSRPLDEVRPGDDLGRIRQEVERSRRWLAHSGSACELDSDSADPNARRLGTRAAVRPPSAACRLTWPAFLLARLARARSWACRCCSGVIRLDRS